MIVSTDDLIAQLNIMDDLSTEDLALIGAKIEAAQNHIERLLGFEIEETFGGVDQDPVPPVLIEAVCQLAAWWFEQREAAVLDGTARPIPFGVQEIVNEYREWTF